MRVFSAFVALVARKFRVVLDEFPDCPVTGAIVAGLEQFAVFFYSGQSPAVLAVFYVAFSHRPI